jgi:hypothetical protein
MKKERKEGLLGCFPPATSAQIEKMKGKGAANYIVFLTRGAELFARGYHRYSNGQLVERQRYVFAKDGAVRYGSENGKQWSVRSEFREPVFCLTSYGYTFDNSYKILGEEAIRQSDMRYSQYDKYMGNLLMCYLNKYCQHPNIEYLMKQGFDPTIEHCTGYWGGRYVLELSKTINWKSNNLLQMLGITKSELKVLRGNEHLYETYISWRNEFPKVSPGDLINFAKVFGDAHGTMATFVEQTGATPQKITRYIEENGIFTRDYHDYLKQCKQLRYNIKDTAICFPHNFEAMHERLSATIEYQHDKAVRAEFAKHIEERKQLEFSDGNLMIVQPKQMADIVYEGKVLSHCVGGYAERHAKGALSIMFIRKKSEPYKPYYTMEVSADGKIVQVRGKRNIAPNKEVEDLIKGYKAYLEKIFSDKRRKTA